MGILNKIFGKKEDQKDKKVSVSGKKREKIRKKDLKPKAVKAVSTPAKAKEVPLRKIKRKDDNAAAKILLEPIISEKATGIAQYNQYVLRVSRFASKNQIKEAIQDYYGVNVISVRTINIKPKKRIQGKIMGKKKGYKKAVVTVAQGQVIDFSSSKQ